MINKKQVISLGFIFFIMAACATPRPEIVTSVQPQQLVAQLEADLKTARANQVNILAPRFYNDAQNSFMKASQVMEKGEKISDIIEYVAEGNNSLEKAKEIAQVSRTILARTNEAREKALKVGAAQLGTPFQKVEEQYMKLTSAIENDNLSYAQKNAAKVQLSFRDLEIMSIKNNILGNVRKIMAKADAAKVQTLSPSAYTDAVKALNEADAYIDRDPYETEGINQRAAQAELMAKRLLAIHDASKKFQEMSPEESAIYLEDLMVQLGHALKTEELRDKLTTSQLATLTDAAVSIGQQRQSLKMNDMNAQTQIAELKKELESLKEFSREQEMAKQQLAAEREFNERFNQIQTYFRPDEAEVYKKGKQLVIRLRGIQFPVGQATLSPDNYTLLSKVQRAISEFGQPMITVEGHTDSTGSEQTNLELSQNRAEAVKTYLVANKTLPMSHIQATGYGPNRPLAPNTTPESRAMNRRIDILITPEMAK